MSADAASKLNQTILPCLNADIIFLDLATFILHIALTKELPVARDMQVSLLHAAAIRVACVFQLLRAAKPVDVEFS